MAGEFKARSPQYYRGGPQNPLSWDALCAKFRDASGKVLDVPSQQNFLANAAGLDKLDVAKNLVGSVAQGNRAHTKSEM